ncbi:MAG: DUF4393 domain-containing protein [Burkholderiaceae bacterium]
MDLIEYTKALGAAVTAWKGTDLLKEIYGDALKPGVAQVGKALDGVLGLGNTALYPIHLLNGRARAALESNLERYRERLANEPIEKIAEVPAEVGVPIAEKLAYVSDPSLAELYVELLAKASLVEDMGLAHPSFVNLINALSPDEAAFLRTWAAASSALLVLPLFGKPTEAVQKIIGEALYEPRTSEGLAFPQNLDAYISNLAGLGVLQTTFDKQRILPGAYDALEAQVKTQYAHIVAPDEQITFKRGLAEVTPYGRMFLQACGVRPRTP